MRGTAYMGFSFIVTSIVLVICSSYRIHISLRAHSGSGSRRLPPGTPLEMIASDEQVPPTEITDFAVESQNPLLVFS